MKPLRMRCDSNNFDQVPISHNPFVQIRNTENTKPLVGGSINVPSTSGQTGF